MGINNRQRRAAKAKKRAKHRAKRRDESYGAPGTGHERRNDEPAGTTPFTSADQVRWYLHALAVDIARAEAPGIDRSMETLARTDARLVRRGAEAEMLAVVGGLWNHGWQPAELIRHARRSSARAGRLLALAVAADHATRALGTLHPRWAAQLDELALPTLDTNTGWLAPFAAVEGLDQATLVPLVVEALVACYSVGRLPTLIPPPGAAPEPDDARAWRDAATSDIDDAVLRKVRALLAQAESTTFEAEAATFTAKAQDLMARHSIDAAMAWSKSERSERPITIRLPIDDPYADVKSWLLHVVAEHSRCRAVYLSDYALSSVVGFASDVASAEMLFTSLLVQSRVALQAEGSTAGPGGRTRSRSFRSSFLMGYVHRIDARLAEINASVEADTVAADANSDGEASVDGNGGSLLPALAERRDVVDDEVDAMFGDLTKGRVRGGDDWLGWERGTFAADRAQLNIADLPAASTRAAS